MQSVSFTGRVNIGSVWGILNNKLFRPDKDGQARYDPIIMAREGKPNNHSSYWSLLSLWLAIEEAIQSGGCGV